MKLQTTVLALPTLLLSTGVALAIDFNKVRELPKNLASRLEPASESAWLSGGPEITESCPVPPAFQPTQCWSKEHYTVLVGYPYTHCVPIDLVKTMMTLPEERSLNTAGRASV